MKKKNILIPVLFLVALIMTGCGENKTKAWRFPDKDSYFKSFSAKTLTVNQLTNIIFSEDTIHFRLIDVRSPHQFKNGHLPHAVNVPIHDLVNPAYKKIINQDRVINVIYGEDASQGRMAGMVAAHYGCKNNWVALGGYDFIKHHMLNRFGIYSANYDDEKPEFDYAKVIAETAGAGTSAALSSGAPPPPKPVAHKKKKAAGGGCE